MTFVDLTEAFGTVNRDGEMGFGITQTRLCNIYIIADGIQHYGAPLENE